MNNDQPTGVVTIHDIHDGDEVYRGYLSGAEQWADKQWGVYLSDWDVENRHKSPWDVRAYNLRRRITRKKSQGYVLRIEGGEL